MQTASTDCRCRSRYTTETEKIITMTKKILFLVTSASKFGEEKKLPTRFWLEELTTPYDIFKEAGYDITFASPTGGPIPIDAGSLRSFFFTDSSKKFLHYADAMDLLCHSKKITDLSMPDFYVLYLPGGHGCCGDFVSNGDVNTAIETLYIADKLVTAVCHAPIALSECVKADGTPLVEGLTVTRFSNEEEEAIKQTANVPFLIET